MFSVENDENRPNGLTDTSCSVLNAVETVRRSGKIISSDSTISSR
jgi:hypothetical protein